MDNSKSQQWQRISPVAIIYFVQALVRSVLGNVVYILPALLILYSKVEENPGLWWPVIYSGVTLILLSAILSFYFFQYRLTEQQIEIRSGVFARKYIDLPFAKIQNVELAEPFYYRPFNYCCMQFDTAGSARQEAKIVAVHKPFAIQLKQQILASQKNKSISLEQTESLTSDTESTTSSTHNEADEVILDRRNLDDLVIHGLTNNRIWLILAGLMPFIDGLLDKVGAWSAYWGITFDQYFEFTDKSFWQIASTFLTLFITIMLFISILSILGAIIMFHDFKLSRYEDKYIRRSGFFTRTEVTMRLSRLQKIVCQQSWLDVLLRRSNLKFEQSNANHQTPESHAQNNRIIVPSVTHKERDHLIQDAFNEVNITEIAFNNVSRRLFLRNMMLIVIPVTTFITYMLITHSNPNAFSISAACGLVITALFYLRYRRWGWATDDKYIYIRNGWLGVNYYIFQRFKVQQVHFMQSWFLQRRQLCSVQMVLASGAISVPYINQHQGYQWLDETLFDVESTRKNWM
ncbi:PH domain-containing protein [Thalassotalea maritima]|uniref:PH domain-containing protein n=1 Tax=Thalassotalea maritima TaxID=3242416 RepID=UPI0035281C1D